MDQGDASKQRQCRFGRWERAATHHGAVGRYVGQDRDECESVVVSMNIPKTGRGQRAFTVPGVDDHRADGRFFLCPPAAIEDAMQLQGGSDQLRQ